MHLRRTPATSAEGRSALLRVRRLVLSRHRASHGVFLFRVVVPYNLSSRVLNQLWRIICNSEEDLVLANRVGKTECIKLVCHCWPRICQKNLVQKEQLTLQYSPLHDLKTYVGIRIMATPPTFPPQSNQQSEAMSRNTRRSTQLRMLTRRTLDQPRPIVTVDAATGRGSAPIKRNSTAI
ncbi:hypothetical protein GmHk_06G017316 [Glycine max]|nr:hypothetical protein GmHk_06G017316 [Glycine max]KAH1247409.1 hypothetical protein GmHk_06G017316 [Glycine max]KAH1247410.1 hypothetical protein GmHk_06G017316 [Glycine max]KAH1247411.1 hypothetical protein GmHk_06G017316 [Glycine max]